MHSCILMFLKYSTELNVVEEEMDDPNLDKREKSKKVTYSHKEVRAWYFWQLHWVENGLNSLYIPIIELHIDVILVFLAINVNGYGFLELTRKSVVSSLALYESSKTS